MFVVCVVESESVGCSVLVSVTLVAVGLDGVMVSSGVLESDPVALLDELSETVIVADALNDSFRVNVNVGSVTDDADTVELPEKEIDEEFVGLPDDETVILTDALGENDSVTVALIEALRVNVVVGSVTVDGVTDKLGEGWIEVVIVSSREDESVTLIDALGTLTDDHDIVELAVGVCIGVNVVVASSDSDGVSELEEVDAADSLIEYE